MRMQRLLVVAVLATACTPKAKPPQASSPKAGAPEDKGYACGHDPETGKLARCDCFGSHPDSTCSDP